MATVDYLRTASSSADVALELASAAAAASCVSWSFLSSSATFMGNRDAVFTRACVHAGVYANPSISFAHHLVAIMSL